MKIARLSFEDDEAVLDPKTLSEYLALFEGCFVAVNDLKISWDGKGNVPDGVSAQLKRISPLQWNEYFDRKASDLISIKTISRNSPLEITLVCAIGILTIATVFSGGVIKIGPKGIEAKLPPLGTGIKSLKSALGLGGRVTPSYSIKTITIILSREELAVLMLQDPGKRNQGGFQNFLVGLQTRVNRNTRQLILSDVDLERIYRYKAEPKKGGFQSRFNKIFGRHFQ